VSEPVVEVFWSLSPNDTLKGNDEGVFVPQREQEGEGLDNMKGLKKRDWKSYRRVGGWAFRSI
jgi:hypothetical protein